MVSLPSWYDKCVMIYLQWVNKTNETFCGVIQIWTATR